MISVRTTGLAVGGEAVAREDAGRVVFVGGALPGEAVDVQLVEQKKAYARGVAVAVRDASPDRVEPPCPHVADGCGGCDWQHVALDAQRRLRRDLVADVLARAAGLEAPAVELGPALPAEGVRTTVRGTAGRDGRFAFRRRRSHDPVVVDECLVAHPLVQEVVEEGRFGPVRDVVVRAGARTGDRLVVLGPSIADPGAIHVPPGVTVVADDELAAGHRAWIHEEAGGRRWRVSAGSFFQASAEGADALVSVVGDLAAEVAASADRVVDLCAGVGLFAGTIGAGRTVTAVERSASAVADARVNLDPGTKVVKVAMERWRPSPADLVIADPARKGLAAAGVAVAAGTGAPAIVLVSCDPAALGRDTRLLQDAGYRHRRSVVLDLFGHTSHVEVVSAFVQAGS